jgi:hypothetical protein
VQKLNERHAYGADVKRQGDGKAKSGQLKLICPKCDNLMAEQTRLKAALEQARKDIAAEARAKWEQLHRAEKYLGYLRDLTAEVRRMLEAHGLADPQSLQACSALLAAHFRWDPNARGPVHHRPDGPLPEIDP